MSLTGYFLRRGREQVADAQPEPGVRDWIGGGEDALAAPPTPPAPGETTDVFPALRHRRDDEDDDQAEDEVNAHAADAIALLQEDLARVREQLRDANGRAAQAGHLADQAHRSAEAAITDATRRAREAEQGARVAVDLADRADRRRAELQQAFDQRWPAPDFRELGRLIERIWYDSHGPAIPPRAAWTKAAQAGYEHIVRGWDIQDRPLTPAERAAIEQNAPADGIPADTAQTSPGGGMAAEAPHAPTAPGAPAPGDPNLEAAAERHREQLGEVLGHRYCQSIGGDWASLPEAVREHYRTRADDVILAGWRPPVAPLLGADRIDAIARVLVDHEQLADGSCRCGWGGGIESHDDPLRARNPLWHAEHVAQQLRGTGVIA